MNCKPGDLAVVINGKGGLRDRIGMVVTVMQLVDRDDHYGLVWHCKASHPVAYYYFSLLTNAIAVTGFCGTNPCVPDDWLRPLPVQQDVISFDQQIKKPESVGT